MILGTWKCLMVVEPFLERGVAIVEWSNNIVKISSKRKLLVVEPFDRKIKLSKCRMWGNLASKLYEHDRAEEADWWGNYILGWNSLTRAGNAIQFLSSLDGSNFLPRWYPIVTGTMSTAMYSTKKQIKKRKTMKGRFSKSNVHFSTSPPNPNDGQMAEESWIVGLRKPANCNHVMGKEDN